MTYSIIRYERQDDEFKPVGSQEINASSLGTLVPLLKSTYGSITIITQDISNNRLVFIRPTQPKFKYEARTMIKEH